MPIAPRTNMSCKPRRGKGGDGGGEGSSEGGGRGSGESGGGDGGSGVEDGEIGGEGSAERSTHRSCGLKGSSCDLATVELQRRDGEAGGDESRGDEGYGEGGGGGGVVAAVVTGAVRDDPVEPPRPATQSHTRDGPWWPAIDCQSHHGPT